MPRYYVSWIIDCAYGAMHVHALFEAPDIQTAKQDWRKLVHEQNQVATEPAYPNKKPLYEELWKLPDFLQEKQRKKFLIIMHRRSAVLLLVLIGVLHPKIVRNSSSLMAATRRGMTHGKRAGSL